MLAHTEHVGGAGQIHDVALVTVELATEDVLDDRLFRPALGDGSLLDGASEPDRDLGADGDAGMCLGHVAKR